MILAAVAIGATPPMPIRRAANAAVNCSASAAARRCRLHYGRIRPGPLHPAPQTSAPGRKSPWRGPRGPARNAARTASRAAARACAIGAPPAGGRRGGRMSGAVDPAHGRRSGDALALVPPSSRGKSRISHLKSQNSDHQGFQPFPRRNLPGLPWMLRKPGRHDGCRRRGCKRLKIPAMAVWAETNTDARCRPRHRVAGAAIGPALESIESGRNRKARPD